MYAYTSYVRFGKVETFVTFYIFWTISFDFGIVVSFMTF